METSAYGVTAPSAVYEIGGRRFDVGSRGLAVAVADAHAAHKRPLCMCLVDGVEMYVARLGEGYIVKRMPDTGSQHAPDCPSYEPPAEFSGLGQVLGSAITEDPVTGETTLKLDFPLTKVPGRSQMPPVGENSDSAASDGTKLTLRGLLHYLWDQAELTRWHPGFNGKRTWTTVRRHLLQAAELKLARGSALRARLYVPEPFAIDQRDAIDARRLAHWQHAAANPGKLQQLMLLIGEVKEIAPARYGFKMVVKHLPDLAFAIDEQLYQRLGRRFETELAVWAASEDIHLVIMATFTEASSGIPTIVELSLMPVTRCWLPIENMNEQLVLKRLVADGRSFVKGLRYNLGKGVAIATAALTDCGSSVVLLFLTNADLEYGRRMTHDSNAQPTTWVWNPSAEPMPALPPPHVQRQQTRDAPP